MVDSPEYLNEAKNIHNYGKFYCGELEKTINPDYYTKRPPIYPLFIASLKLISQSDLLIILVQSIISILSILIIRKTFIRIGYDTNYDRLFILLLILSPAQLIYANLIMSEIIFQFILALAFYYIVRYLFEINLKYLLFFSLLIILSALTKPVMYLFVYPLFIVTIYLSFKNKSFRPFLIGIIPIVIIQFYSYWNYKRTEYWTFSSIQSINLVQYNTYYFNVQRFGSEKANMFLDNQINQSNTIEGYPQKKRFLVNSSKQTIKGDIIGYMWFHTKGMLRFFIDPGRFDLSNFFGLESKGNVGFLNYLNNSGIRGTINYLLEQNIWLIISLIAVGIFNIIKLLGLFLFLIHKSIDVKIRLIVFVIIGYVTFATGPLGASRFAMPFIPIIIFSTLIAMSRLEIFWNKSLKKYNTFRNTLFIP
ncbi:MAG: glycosyltransferase family 39 protein [Bacteroidales bacterium]